MNVRRYYPIIGALLYFAVMTAIVVGLWPNGEAILTVGALITVIAGYLVLISWSQRRRRRGEEAGRTNAEGADAMTGWPGGA